MPMSTVGRDVALQIVIPLADKDCDRSIGPLSDSLGELVLDDGGGSFGDEK